jgi:2',3'-cyclic-nucleotide 2'-phosphodiesterase (5'-nucleotidase family)
MLYRPTRRQVLRTTSAGALAALFTENLWPGTLRAAEPDAGEFHFVVANDLHYFDQDCAPFFHRVVDKIKQQHQELGIDLVLLAGDVSDWGQDFQFAAIRDIFKTTGIDTHVVCGNHDWADWDDRKNYLDIYPKSLNYTFEHKGWQFVALDSTNHNLKGRVKVTDETLHWLDENVPKIDSRRPVITFTHFPMHPQLQWPAMNAADVLASFKDHNLTAVFGGHCHAQHEQNFRGAPVVTNKCCSHRVPNHDRTPEKGYFLCHAKDGKVTREFIEIKPA